MGKAGWKKLEDHEGEDGTVCVIRMNTKDGTFMASVGPDYNPLFCEEGKDLEKIREVAKNYLSGCVLSQWESVIFIRLPQEVENKDRYNSWESPYMGAIDFSYSRFFKSKRSDGRMAWKEFEVVKPFKDQHGQLLDGKNMDKVEGKPGETCSEPKEYETEEYAEVPYTPERWSALRLITRRIEDINQKIREQLGPKKAALFLDSVAKQGAQFLLENKAKV